MSWISTFSSVRSFGVWEEKSACREELWVVPVTLDTHNPDISKSWLTRRILYDYYTLLKWFVYCHVSTTVSFKFWIHESSMIRGTRSVTECPTSLLTHPAIFPSPPHVDQVECFFTKQIFDLCLEAEKSDRNKKDSPDRHRGVQVFRLWLVVYSIQSSKGLTLPDWVSP